MDELPVILKIEEVCAYLRCSKGTIYSEIRAGRLPVIRMSARVWRVSRAGLEKWIANQGGG